MPHSSGGGTRPLNFSQFQFLFCRNLGVTPALLCGAPSIHGEFWLVVEPRQEKHLSGEKKTPEEPQRRVLLPGKDHRREPTACMLKWKIS